MTDLRQRAEAAATAYCKANQMSAANGPEWPVYVDAYMESARVERYNFEQAARDFVGQIVAPRSGW